MFDALKKLDAYPKISLDDRDFRNKTVLGAASMYLKNFHPQCELSTMRILVF